MPRKPLALAAALIAVALQASSAHAAPALVGTFDVSDMPGRITAGPDGNMWFTIGGGAGHQIGKITPSGDVTEFGTPGDVGLTGLTAGPDGNLWGTGTNKIVRMPTSDPSTGTAFTDAAIGSAEDIVTGPDGHLWTGSDNGVVEIDPNDPGDTASGGSDEFHAIFTGTGLGIAAGSDGNLWITDDNPGGADDSAIVRFDTAGNVIGTPVHPTGRLQQSQIAAGPAGQLLFTQPTGNTVQQRVGRIDFSGNIQFTNMPGGTGVDPTGVVFGNDQAYWTANFANNKLGRLTPSGDFTQPISFDAGSGPRRIAKGPNDTLWVSLEQTKKIAKITGVSAPPGGGNNPPPPPPDTKKPVVSSLKLSDTSFLVGSQLASFSRKRTPVGTTISFNVSENSRTTFTFARKSKGFKSGKRCVAHRPKRHKHAKRCARFVKVKPSLSFATSGGAHKLEFEGRLNRHKKLKPGSYRLSVSAVDTAGNKTKKPKTANFRVLKK